MDYIVENVIAHHWNEIKRSTTGLDLRSFVIGRLYIWKLRHPSRQVYQSLNLVADLSSNRVITSSITQYQVEIRIKFKQDLSIRMKFFSHELSPHLLTFFFLTWNSIHWKISNREGLSIVIICQVWRKFPFKFRRFRAKYKIYKRINFRDCYCYSVDICAFIKVWRMQKCLEYVKYVRIYEIFK